MPYNTLMNTNPPMKPIKKDHWEDLYARLHDDYVECITHKHHEDEHTGLGSHESKQTTPLYQMKPKFRVILEQALEEGIRRGYRRAFKHNEDPSEEVICETIEDCVMGSLYEYFTFDNEDDQ